MGQEKLEGERERVETSSERICMDRLERERFEVFCLDFEAESVWNSLVFRCLFLLCLRLCAGQS